mmetsp:Transcript_3389/g.7795  ORF Transcript_3389/g.7795 Transcript_3389/m.7795 type:complete len:260 (-) Transcript_3389:299-1078(-)
MASSTSSLPPAPREAKNVVPDLVEDAADFFFFVLPPPRHSSTSASLTLRTSSSLVQELQGKTPVSVGWAFCCCCCFLPLLLVPAVPYRTALMRTSERTYPTASKSSRRLGVWPPRTLRLAYSGVPTNGASGWASSRWPPLDRSRYFSTRPKSMRRMRLARSSDDDMAFRLVFGFFFFWAVPPEPPSGASMKLSALTSTKRRRMAWNASRWEMSVVAMGPRSMAVGAVLVLADRPFWADAEVTRRGTTSVRGPSIFSMHR